MVNQAVGHWESLRQGCLPLQSVVKEVVECPDSVSWDTLPAGLSNLPELPPWGRMETTDASRIRTRTWMMLVWYIRRSGWRNIFNLPVKFFGDTCFTMSFPDE